MFSDNTELHYCHGDISTVEHTVQSDLESIYLYIWLTVNRVKLNVSSLI